MSDIIYVKGEYKDYYYADSNKVFGFFSEHRYLSNFHKCDVLWDGLIWPSSEHAYMASKCENTGYCNLSNTTIDGQKTYNGLLCRDICSMKCHEVKKWGMTVDLKPNWEDIKFNMMYSICLDKFTRNEDIRKKLLGTGNRELIEANNWRDCYWGYDVNLQKGQNNLGKILMTIRMGLKWM